MATIPVKKNEATAARRRVYFHCVDATDGMTPETAEAGGQPQISVDGGAWTNTGIGVLVAIGNGRYYADLTQAICNVTDATINTRYKSAATAEAVGDTVVIDGRLDEIYNFATDEELTDLLWDEPFSGHTVIGTYGYLMYTWMNQLDGIETQMGYLYGWLGNQIDRVDNEDGTITYTLYIGASPWKCWDYTTATGVRSAWYDAP